MIKSGVLFAPLDFPSHELIRNSSAVCVTTGTAGFESIVGFKKPVLAFSDSWYSSLPGIIKINNISDIKKAFKLINAGKAVLNEDDIMMTINNLIDHSFLLTFASVPNGQHCNYISLNLAKIWSFLLKLDENSEKLY